MTAIPTPSKLMVPVLMAGTLGQSLLFTITAPLLPAIAARYPGNGETIAQILFSLPSLGLVLAGLAGGWIIDRVGLRPTLLYALAAYALLGIAPFFINAIVPTLASRLLLGVACGLATTTATLLLVSTYEGEKRNAMLGFQTSSGSFGGLIALVVAGLIASRFDWRLAYLLYAATMLPFLLLAVRSVPPLRTRQATKGSSIGATIGAMWPIYIAAAALFLPPTMVGAQTPFLLGLHGITDPFTHSIVIAMATIGVTLAAPTFGAIHHRIGTQRTFALGLAFNGGGLILLGLSSGSLGAGAGSLIAGIGAGLYFPHLWMVTTSLAPLEMRAQAIALLSTAMFLGGFAYPAVVGPIAAVAGPAGPFLVLGSAIMLGAILALVARQGQLICDPHAASA